VPQIAGLWTRRNGAARLESGRQPGQPNEPPTARFKRPSRRMREPFDYLVLLLCSSANLGSGVSGGRCGLTTSLNQASC
jgi:hypothetical protein